MIGWLGWGTGLERRKGVRTETTGACWPLAGLGVMPGDVGAVRGFKLRDMI